MAGVNAGAAVIDRTFVRIAAGRIHLRIAGAETSGATPLVMLHGGPGSSAGLQPLIGTLARGRRVIAPDTMGAGDSDPPPDSPTDIVFYADCLMQVLDALDVDKVDIYGHHTGAQVACEFVIAHPERVNRLVLDGAALFLPALRAEFLELYAPPIVPDERGLHLGWIWEFASRLTRYFPYYDCSDDAKIVPATILPPAAVTTIAAEILKNWSTFHFGYQAAFRHDLRDRLPLVRARALVFETTGDPLACYAAEVARLLPVAQTATVTRAAKASAIAAFLYDPI